MGSIQGLLYRIEPFSMHSQADNELRHPHDLALVPFDHFSDQDQSDEVLPNLFKGTSRPSQGISIPPGFMWHPILGNWSLVPKANIFYLTPSPPDPSCPFPEKAEVDQIEDSLSEDPLMEESILAEVT